MSDETPVEYWGNPKFRSIYEGTFTAIVSGSALAADARVADALMARLGIEEEWNETK